jgi:phage shock protein PspC (stress-responsive transcriptional regulator)/two-component sensor histidine kinase
MDPSAGTRRLERSADDRWVAGICGGLAGHFGQPAWLFRVLFLVTSLLGGAGIVAYALLWLFLPLQPPGSGGPARPGRAGSWDLTGLLGFVSLGLGILLALGVLGVPVRISVWAPLILVGAGVVVLWRQGDEVQRVLRPPAEGLPPAVEPLADRGLWVRVLVGLLLLVLGVVGFVGPRITLATAAQAVLAAGAVVAGLVIIALPWITAWSTRRQAERFAAVRNEERAAMAARVHDSVLQTLTLIQRRADDPREVARLARSEERALRSWLYAPVGASGTLAAALAEVVATTEADYDARIELVTVGDSVVDDRVAALVAATREAVVNAAKHAQAPATVYAEVTEGEVEVNVKDRGRGFDPDAIGDDRHGVRESIVARMAAVDGRAGVRSGVGQGTEIRLILPLGADRG